MKITTKIEIAGPGGVVDEVEFEYCDETKSGDIYFRIIRNGESLMFTFKEATELRNFLQLYI